MCWVRQARGRSRGCMRARPGRQAHQGRVRLHSPPPRARLVDGGDDCAPAGGQLAERGHQVHGGRGVQAGRGLCTRAGGPAVRVRVRAWIRGAQGMRGPTAAACARAQPGAAGRRRALGRHALRSRAGAACGGFSQSKAGQPAARAGRGAAPSSRMTDGLMSSSCPTDTRLRCAYVSDHRQRRGRLAGRTQAHRAARDAAAGNSSHAPCTAGAACAAPPSSPPTARARWRGRRTSGAGACVAPRRQTPLSAQSRLRGSALCQAHARCGEPPQCDLTAATLYQQRC